ncbi:MAG: hypothetical protein IT578_01650 [Verrucomicrobiae bacterium]|nr:hypothetical protein [Verrucomicrobiae bacterium]
MKLGSGLGFMGKLGGPTDMGGWHSVAFSYKVMVKSGDKSPNLQFELHQAAGSKGAIHGFSNMVMDENWQEVEVPLDKFRESYRWDLVDVGAVAVVPRFPAGVKVDVTFKFGGFRLVK